MNIERIYLGYLLLFLLSSCTGERKTNQAGEIEIFARAEVESEVRTMLDAYFSAIKEDGLSAEFEYLDDSEDFFWVPPGYQSALTYDSVRSVLTKNSPLFQSIEFRWRSLQIIPLSRLLATYTGIVDGKMIDTAGISMQIGMIETGTVIKRDDGWKLLSGQSRNLPADN